MPQKKMLGEIPRNVGKRREEREGFFGRTWPTDENYMENAVGGTVRVLQEAGQETIDKVRRAKEAKGKLKGK